MTVLKAVLPRFIIDIDNNLEEFVPELRDLKVADCADTEHEF